MLTLTQLAIYAYDERPLGESLTNTVTPEVRRWVVLQELLAQANSTRFDKHQSVVAPKSGTPDGTHTSWLRCNGSYLILENHHGIGLVRSIYHSRIAGA
jgi:hypothetical protein